MIESAAEFVRLRLSDDHSEQARATHEEASEQVWLDVIRDHPEMRQWVAHNKAVPLSILDVLAADPDPRVRSTVASKRKQTADRLEALARDADESVRARVALNPRTELDVVRKLTTDDCWIVRDAASSALERRGNTTRGS